MTPEEKFRLGREIICHENELVNHRMTWLLLVTGFLLSALFTVIGNADKVVAYFGVPYIIAATVFIALVGFYAAAIAAVLIAQAHAQTDGIRKWWKDLDEDKSELPPTISGELKPSRWNWLKRTERLAWFIALMWVVVLVLTVVAILLPHPSATHPLATPSKICAVTRPSETNPDISPEPEGWAPRAA